MLEEKINNDLKTALKSGDKITVSVLRFLICELKNKKIETRSDKLEEVEIISVVQKQMRRRNESIQSFEKGGRPELAEKEKKERDILAKYAPAPLRDEDLEKIVRKAIESTGATSMKDMGAVMKSALAEIKGRADSKKVSDLVREKLGC